MLYENRIQKTIKLGFAPTRRSMVGEKAFNKAEAQKWKKLIESKIKEYKIDIVNLDFLNEEGLLFDGLDSKKVAKKFIEEDVDAIFAPHCNFGSEDAVSKLAKQLNLPILIWGPRDDSPEADGYRLRDSQCGLFATSKVLSRYSVPFSYITNCKLTDEIFDRGFKNFIRATSIVRAMKNPRIGQISTRPNAFWSVKYNEAELQEKFGIEVVPITMPDLKNMYNKTLKTQKEEISILNEHYKSSFDKITFPDDYLTKVSALKLTIKNWAKEEQLDAAATQCWGPMAETIGISPCFVLSDLTDDGFPTICEADMHGAVSALMGQAAALSQTPVFLADVTIRHPENDNAELFWHCGVFPKSLKKEDSPSSLTTHYNRKIPAVSSFEIKGGDITLVRFDSVNGKYSLLMGHGKGTSGPKTVGTYGWIEFNDWSKWEHKFIYGPYIHHCVGVHGKYAPALYEACKYIPALSPDPVEPSASEIEKYLRR